MAKLICIVCPRGCHITAEKNSDGSFNVTGNTCKRGYDYAVSELTHPTRMITSTCKVAYDDGLDHELMRCPVVTSKPIPKEKIFDVMNEINKVSVKYPVNMHQVVISNVLGLDVDIIATREIR